MRWPSIWIYHLCSTISTGIEGSSQSLLPHPFPYLQHGRQLLEQWYASVEDSASFSSLQCLRYLYDWLRSYQRTELPVPMHVVETRWWTSNALFPGATQYQISDIFVPNVDIAGYFLRTPNTLELWAKHNFHSKSQYAFVGPSIRHHWCIMEGSNADCQRRYGRGGYLFPGKLGHEGRCLKPPTPSRKQSWRGVGQGMEANQVMSNGTKEIVETENGTADTRR